MVATVEDLTGLAEFLSQLTALSARTGVKIEHYDRVQLTLPSGGQTSISHRPDAESGEIEYFVDERESS